MEIVDGPGGGIRVIFQQKKTYFLVSCYFKISISTYILWDYPFLNCVACTCMIMPKEWYFITYLILRSLTSLVRRRRLLSFINSVLHQFCILSSKMSYDIQVKCTVFFFSFLTTLTNGLCTLYISEWPHHTWLEARLRFPVIL